MALSNKDASIVLGMLARGDNQHDVAAWFGENGGRIAEIAGGSYGSIAAAPNAELPPRGPVGRKARRLKTYVQAALTALANGGDGAVTEAVTELEAGLASFNRDEN